MRPKTTKIIIALAFSLGLLAGAGGLARGAADTISSADIQKAIQEASSACADKQASLAPDEWAKGPCVSEDLLGDGKWAADVRTGNADLDQATTNRCSTTAPNIIYLSPSCQFKGLFSNGREIPGTHLEIQNYPVVGGKTITPFTTPADLVQYLFLLSLAVVGIIALVNLVFAGLEWMLSGSVSGASDAKKRMSGVFLGIFVLLLSYLTLKLINPQLVRIRNPRMPQIKVNINYELFKLFCKSQGVAKCEDYDNLKEINQGMYNVSHVFSICRQDPCNVGSENPCVAANSKHGQGQTCYSLDCGRIKQCQDYISELLNMGMTYDSGAERKDFKYVCLQDPCQLGGCFYYGSATHDFSRLKCENAY